MFGTLLLFWPPSGAAPPPPPPAATPVEAAVASFLAANLPGLTSWHGVIPQTQALPALAWQVVDGDSGTNLAGASGLGRRHVQFTVYSARPGDCWAWIETLRLAFVGAAGRAAFLCVTARPPRSGFEAEADSSGKGIHSNMREFYISFPEGRG